MSPQKRLEEQTGKEIETAISRAQEDFERQFSATASYETTMSLAAVQEELVSQMTKDIVGQIYNATVVNW